MNSTKVIRPIAFIQDQETKELVKTLVKFHLTPMVHSVVKNGLDLLVPGGLQTRANQIPICPKGLIFHSKVRKQSFCLLDGKMITTLTNSGGAYCQLCIATEEEAHDLEHVVAGFTINKTMQMIQEVAAMLDKGDGTVRKKKGDQKIRLGVCGDPLTDLDANLALPVCHLKILVVDFIFKNLLPRENSVRKHPTIFNR